MADIKKNGITEHEGGLKDVEEDLVADDGARVEVGRRPVGGLEVEELHGAEDAADEDEPVAQVQRQQRLVQFRVADPVPAALVPEVGRQREEEPDHHQLQDERRPQQRPAQLLS